MQRNPGGVTSLQIQWQPKADMVTKDVNVASGLQGVPLPVQTQQDHSPIIFSACMKNVMSHMGKSRKGGTDK